MYPLLLFYIYKHTKGQEQCIKMIAWSGSVQRRSLVYRGWYITVYYIHITRIHNVCLILCNVCIYINSMSYVLPVVISTLIVNRDKNISIRDPVNILVQRRKRFLYIIKIPVKLYYIQAILTTLKGCRVWYYDNIASFLFSRHYISAYSFIFIRHRK